MPLHVPKVRVKFEPNIADPIIVGRAVAVGFVNTLVEKVLEAVVPVPAFRAVTETNMKKRPSESDNL